MSVRQKLGVILESKVVQKLSLEKKNLIKNGLLNWYSEIIFFLKKFDWFLTSKIDFESTILALFDEL